MELKIKVDPSATLEQLEELSARQFMLAWTTAVKQFAQQQAREKIGGDFGHEIGNHSILIDDQDPLKHSVYVGGENGYIAEHIHTGGPVRPKSRKYLAIPIDKSVKKMYPREYSGDLVLIRKKEDGPNGRAYLAKPMKNKIKPLFVLKRQIVHKAKPWFPDEAAAQAETEKFFNDNF